MKYLHVAILMLVGALGGTAVRADETAASVELRIATAANFQQTLERITKAFEEEKHVHADISSGASGVLYGQISQGAPFDLFFSADTQRPAQLEKDDGIVPGSRFTYAVGTLVAWRPGHKWSGDLESVLKSGQVHTVAIANPTTAPYGAAAVQTMDKLGFAESSTFKRVQGESIGQTFQFLTSGNADLGFVALAQVREYEASSGKSLQKEIYLVPEKLHDPITQDAVWLKRAADNANAKAFLEYLKSSKAQSIVKAAGYTVPAK
jgi:molybdate transport system substrate-binding protein